VPSEVKNAYPSVYLPPQIDLPAQPTTPPSSQPTNGEHGNQEKEGVKRSREESHPEGTPSTSSRSAPVDATEDSAKPKKKRITPLLSQSPISPSSLFGKEGQPSESVPIDLTSSDSNHGLPSKTGEVSSSQQQLSTSSESAKKVKKRITPVAGPPQAPPIPIAGEEGGTCTPTTHPSTVRL
jgi:hypothetical protein